MRDVRKFRGSPRTGRRFELHIENLTIERGRMYGVTGASGSGKSTFMALAAMALKPETAACFTFVSDRGRSLNIAEMWRHNQSGKLAHIRSASLGYVLQQGGLFDAVDVLRNIELPSRIRGKVDRDWIRFLSERLGIADVLRRLPSQISVGQRQRTAIARALANRPEMILADEPTASVDPLNADRIFALFVELVGESGAALVVSSHDTDRVTRPDFIHLHHELTESDTRIVSTLKVAR